MKKSKFVAIIIFIILFPLSCLFLQNNLMQYQRHYLLCEVLKPGMSKNEVLELLKQSGEFSMNFAEWSDGFFEIGISYTNLQAKLLYGNFELGFYKYQYNRAFIRHGSDNYEDICDFSTNK